MTAEKHSTEKKRSSLLITWPFSTFLREAFVSFYFSGFVRAKDDFFWYPRKMKSLFVPQDGVAGTGGVSWSSYSPLWVGGQAVFRMSGIASLSSPPCLPPFTRPIKLPLPKHISLPEGRQDGTQLEVKEHISVHVYFLFGLPVKIQQRFWMCFSC